MDRRPITMTPAPAAQPAPQAPNDPLQLSPEGVPMGPAQQPIGVKELREVQEELSRYRSGKARLEQRVQEDDDWWRLRQTEPLQDPAGSKLDYPSSWLFASVMQKHAYAIENYPEDNILAREADDEEEAERLSSIIPVVKRYNNFRETYSIVQWRKMQSGTGIYGVFWDPSECNGLGDVSIKPVNILNLFWEPGVSDIQQSRYVFHVEKIDRKKLQAQYPDIDIGPANSAGATREYHTEDRIDRARDVEVVDWYYHTWRGRTKALHYVKYTGETILYSSENAGEPYWYEDGDFPFVFDVLFPMEGSPAGFGYIDVGKSAQRQIDLVNEALLSNALMRARPRYFANEASGINREQFANWREQLVDVQGSLDERQLKIVDVPGLDGNILSFGINKVQELKETTSNQDIQTGSTSGGVTAASAIQALQQSAGMPSKDSTRTAHRANELVTLMIISRMRQFYTLPRQFRITGKRGEKKFIEFSNAHIQPQQQTGLMGEDMGMRKPIFDVDVVSENENAYTKLTNNELIKDLYGMGFFNPDNSPIALMVMEFMDFARKDEIMDAIRENGTYRDLMLQYGQMAVALAAKYQPDMAQQLAQKLAADAGEQAAAPGSAPQRSAAERQILGEMPAAEQKARAAADAAVTVD